MRIEMLNKNLMQAVGVYLYARELFVEYPCELGAMVLTRAAADVDAALNALDEELKRIKECNPADMVEPVTFIVRIETPHKTLGYEYESEHDAMLAYEKARLDMKLSRESNRVTLSRGDSILRSADLM